MYKKILLLSLVFLLSSCYGLDIVEKANNQNILIKTPFVTGAMCFGTDDIGRKWALRRTPGTMTVKTGHSPLTIICKKKGHKTDSIQISEYKHELLSIDGERINIGMDADFWERSPRLIPSLVKETVGFVADPTANYSTQYPREVVLWLEPKQWASEEEQIKWAYEKQIYQNSMTIAQEDAIIKDELRKRKRREKKFAEEREMDEFIKTINPVTYIKKLDNVRKEVSSAISDTIDRKNSPQYNSIKKFEPKRQEESFSHNNTYWDQNDRDKNDYTIRNRRKK